MTTKIQGIIIKSGLPEKQKIINSPISTIDKKIKAV